MADQLTRNDVIDAINRFEATVIDWHNDSSAPRVDFGGDEVKAISQALEAEIEAFASWLDTDAVDDDARELILQCDRFIEEYRDFEDKFTRGVSVHPGGPGAMWNAWEKAVDMTTQAKQSRTVEDFSTLIAQNVPPQQIARIMHWYTAAGTPDIGKVNEEIQNPGTHYQPGQINTAGIQAEKAIEEAWQKRLKRREGVKAIAEAKSQKREAPESVEQLLSQNVSSAQISRMKGITVEEVKAIARELQLPIDNMDPGPRRGSPMHDLEAARLQDQRKHDEAQASIDERAKSESKVNTYPELGAVEERIKQMVFDGNSNTAMYNALTADGVDISESQMRKIARNVRKEIETAS